MGRKLVITLCSQQFVLCARKFHAYFLHMQYLPDLWRVFLIVLHRHCSISIGRRRNQNPFRPRPFQLSPLRRVGCEHLLKVLLTPVSRDNWYVELQFNTTWGGTRLGFMYSTQQVLPVLELYSVLRGHALETQLVFWRTSLSIKPLQAEAEWPPPRSHTGICTIYTK